MTIILSSICSKNSSRPNNSILTRHITLSMSTIAHIWCIKKPIFIKSSSVVNSCTSLKIDFLTLEGQTRNDKSPSMNTNMDAPSGENGYKIRHTKSQLVPTPATKAMGLESFLAEQLGEYHFSTTPNKCPHIQVLIAIIKLVEQNERCIRRNTWRKWTCTSVELHNNSLPSPFFVTSQYSKLFSHNKT